MNLIQITKIRVKKISFNNYILENENDKDIDCPEWNSNKKTEEAKLNDA